VKPSEIIREGMKHVEAGWCKGKLQDPEKGNVCAQGGMRLSAFGCLAPWLRCAKGGISSGEDFKTALKAMDTYAQVHGFTSHTHLNDYGQFGLYPTISDEFGRNPTTQQDVLTMMEKSATALEEAGQ
jgi:hypothetical protein